VVRLFSIAAVAVLSALTFAAPSQALSCLRPTPERSFAQFNDAPELYQIWSGRWIQTNPIPEADGYVDPLSGTKPEPTLFRFRGRMVGPEGVFGPIRSWQVKVAPQCAGPWCAGFPQDGEEVVGFFERPSTGFRRFEPSPCGGDAFPRTIETIDRLSACFTSGACN